MKRFIVAILVLFMAVNLVSVPVEAGSESLQVAKYIMSWQLDNGGWSKDKPEIFTRYWNGTENKAKYYQRDGVTPLGTIDNDATVSQLEYLAAVYHDTRNSEVKASIIKGFDFLLKMQYPSGGFPQVYPEQQAAGSVYENDATFNDHATVNVLTLYKSVLDKESQYNNGLISSTLYNKIQDSFNRGVDFILKAQIEVNGVKTVWGGQHDPYTYKTTKGRSFEPISQISQESAKIVEFLESLNSSDPRIRESILSAKIWFHETVLEDVKYVRNGVNGEYFISSPGTRTWYRFYEIGTNKGIFGDRDGSVSYDIHDISLERILGYGWAGTWGKTIYYAASLDDYTRELVTLNPYLEEPVVEEPVVEEEEEVNDDYFFNQGEWIARGSSYIDGNGFHFIESGEDTIQSPVLNSVNKGDRITIELEITNTDRTSSVLVLNNEGLRSANSEWQIGYGIKTRTISFDVNADYADKDKYLAFKIDGGQNGESIDVSYIDIYVNGEKQVFEEKVVVEEPVVEEPVVEEPVVEAGTVVFTQGSDESYVYDEFETVNVGDTVIIDMDIIEAKTSNGKLVLNNTGLRSDKSEWVIGNGVKPRHIEFTITEEFANSNQYLEFIIAGGQNGDYIVIDNLSVKFNRVIVEEPVVEEPVVEEPVVEEPVVEEPVVEAGTVVFTQGSDESYVYDEFETVNVGDTVIIDMDIIEAKTSNGKLVLNNTGLRSDKSEWVIGNGVKPRHIEFTITEEFANSNQYLEFIIAGGQNGDYIVIDNLSVKFNRVIVEEPVVEEPVVEEPVVEEPVVEEPVVEEPVVEAGTVVFTQGSDESYVYDEFETVNVGDTVIIDMDIIEAKTSNGKLVLNNTGLRSDKSEWVIGNGVKPRHIEFTITEEFANSNQYLEFIIAGGQNGDYIIIDNLSVKFNRVIVEEPVVEEPVVEEPMINSFTARNVEFVQGANNALRTIDLTAANPGDTVVVKITIKSTDRETSELYLNNVGLRDGLGLWKIGYGVKTREFDFTINVSDLRDSDKYLEFIIADGQDGESIFVEKLEVTIK